MKMNTSESSLYYLNLLDGLETSTLGSTFAANTNSDLVESASYFDSNKSPFILGITILYSILIVTSLTSNPLLIYVLLWRRKSQIKLIDIFVANLSLSDLFLTIFNIPLSLIIYFSDEWPFGSLLCQLGTYSTSCSIYVNIFTMAYISIDRYFAVTRPQISNPNYQMRKTSILLDEKTRKKIYLVLTLIWIIASILSVPQFFFSKVSRSKLKYEHSLDEQVSNMSSTMRVTSTTTTKASNTLDNLDPGDSMLMNEAEELSQEISEDPFKQCLLSYPIKNMKIYMIFINFSLQYLIPSLVIIYFYGKIIYHLYLNLNIEELMEAPKPHHHHHNTPHQTPTRLARFKQAISISTANTTNQLTDDSINLATSSALTLNDLKSNTSATNARRKKSRMRIEGLNRTRNLKKSIKVMIIIIALFLLSWLPIHLYRLVTTYIPFFEDLFDRNVSYSSSSTLKSGSVELSSFGNLSLEFLLQDCKRNTTSDKDCIYNTINKAIKEIRVPEVQNIRINTLHNRYVFFICYFMSMSSVCYNPIVYFWMHKKFRAEVKQLLSRMFIFKIKKRSQSTTSTNTRLQLGLQAGQTANSNHSNTTNKRILSNVTQANNNCNNDSDTIYFKRQKSASSSNDKNSDMIRNIDEDDEEESEIARLARLSSDSSTAKKDSLSSRQASSGNNQMSKKLSSGIFASIKSRNKRFYSLSSESTTSRKSNIDL